MPAWLQILALGPFRIQRRGPLHTHLVRHVDVGTRAAGRLHKDRLR